MSTSTGSLSLLRNVDDSPYDPCGYFIRKDSNKFSKRNFLSLFIAILIIGLLVKVLYFNQPTLDYSREDDEKLYQYIYVSPAAQKLPIKGQLFCWVQTAPIYHDTRAIAINETWISRCDHGQLFTSSIFNDSKIPYSTVFAGIPENYYNLFFKSRFAFHYIWESISQDFKWYMKADDDTYVIVEHLRDFLSTLDHNKPYYLGYILKPYLKNGYNAGGAGYVLSREALRLFSEEAYYNETTCPDDIYEDVGIGRCLSNLGVYPHDTRNSHGQNRFYQYTPADLFHATKASPKYTWFAETQGYPAFATDMISFHHLTPDEIRLFDILLYRTDRPKKQN